MAKLDRKIKENQQGEKHSLSSFEKKRGAKLNYNAQKYKKYCVANVQRKNGEISPVNSVRHSDKDESAAENDGNTQSVKNTARRTLENEQAYRKKDSHIPDAVNKYGRTVQEPEKTITPEMALRMKRAALIAQKNEEAIRLNRAAAVSSEEEQEVISEEKLEYPKETADVSVEHPDEKQGKSQGSSCLGNSEHAVFDTYNNDVRAYRAKNAYGEYIRKQKSNARERGTDRIAGNIQTVGEFSRGEVGKVISDAVVGSVAGESVLSAVNGAETVSQTVSGSDSVGSTVLDVSSALAAIEAKKIVKKLAETDIKKKHRADERMKNHGNRFGIDKYDEVTGKNEKSKDSKKAADRNSETSREKQGSTKVGSSHKLQQEKQEYSRKQRAKEVKGKQKEIFIKENKKTPNTLYSGAVGKASIVKHLLKKKGASVILGGGFTVVLPILITIIVLVIIMGFFGWLTPFSYVLAGEDPDNEHNAETKAEIIDGYTLMVKNYMDITQAYYYLNYGDWYGGTYQYEDAGLDFGTFFSEYSQKIIRDIQAQFQAAINQAKTPEEARAVSQAMGYAISQALSQAQQAAYEEYTLLIVALNDGLTPSEHRQHYEIIASGGANGIYDSAEFNDKPVVGTNFFGNVEINSDLSSEELLSYIALYKSLIAMNPDDANADPDAEEPEPSLNITPQDIMDFFEKTGYISITAEITHNKSCSGQNCKRRLIGDYESGYSWEYYCEGNHDNLTGAIGECLSADELLEKVMELTKAEDIGVDEKNCKKILEAYVDMFKKELNIDESGFRQFGAKDSINAQEFYEELINSELQNSELWQINTPFTDGG